MSENRKNQAGQYVPSILSAVVFHPLTYYKTLAQLGHEPLAPCLGRKHLFSSVQVWYYPNAFQYLKHIREEDGFFGMYRGLGPRICCNLITNVASSKTSSLLESWYKKEEIQDDDTEIEAWRKLASNTALESVAHAVGITVGYPFHVIMVRSMAQFIGKEHTYDNSFNSIAEIYNTEGIRGFFLGLVPRLIAELMTIWIAKALVLIYKRYIRSAINKENAVPADIGNTLCSIMASYATYPLHPVATVMCVNGSSLVAGKEPLGRKVFATWQECYKHLAKAKALNRGQSLFWRKCPTQYM